VRLNGKDFYLGKHGSPESRNKYNQLVSEWLTNNQQIPKDKASTPPTDLDMTDKIWIYTPKSHKMQHRGRERIIYIGSRAQAVIHSFLKEDLTAYLFSPIEAEKKRNARRRANRKSPMTPSQSKRKPKKNQQNPLRDHYSKDSYRHAIQRACDKAGVPRWSPNQL